jgi:hypothetical protein
LSLTTDFLVADPSRGTGSDETCVALGGMVINPRKVAVYGLRDIPKHTDITE